MAPDKVPSSNNYIGLIAHFIDFLTVATHTILYERNVYPRESFISARKYNYPVRQSRHPKLCEWINDATNHLEKQLTQGSVEKVSIVICSSAGEPLERFVFDLSQFPRVKRQDWFTDFAQDSQTSKFNSVNVEEQFRAVMSKLAYCHRDLEPLPRNCTFNIAIELREDAQPPISHPQPWIPAVSSLQKEKETGDKLARVGEDLGGAVTTPIRLVDAGPMIFEMWVEESQTKIDSLSQNQNTDKAGQVSSAVKSKGKAKASPQSASVEDDYDDDFPDRLSQFSFMQGKK
jgi:mitotic spindle assembly checkpoint protein MAD2B